MPPSSLRDLVNAYFPFGFQLSQRGWDEFTIVRLLAHELPFGPDNIRYAVRRLADRFNERPPSTGRTFVPIHAEQLLSLGVLNDAMRFMALHYCIHERPDAITRVLAWARQRVGEATVDRLFPEFVQLFPPGTVAAGLKPRDAWLVDGEAVLGVSGRVAVESILLYLMMRNPATRPLRELFDDEELQRRAGYVPVVVSFEEFFDREEPSGVSGKTLFHTLRAPILASPDSLEGQLAFIRAHWAAILPPEMLARIDLARDLMREMDLHRAPEYGPPPVLTFGGSEAGSFAEPAAFSRDADWMSNVVLIAKSTYVWLDQLSKRHGRPVRTLADIPDEELDRLAAWGFTGLWLIGLWQRSEASRKIKQYQGNPEAVASAYSLDEYRIADDLGGDEAYANLRERAWQRGIRLASDMVPNHMGIDSRWVIEHPDWFLQSPRPPFPAYRFTGGDLCDHSDVEVRIEEGYWHRTDAAVVFERRDTRNGENRYIYHGNDGTSMPWNDTAQLDFTRADVREAVIQTILHVARRFPIIRFDAAMTLARKHFQRLWFPAPGDAGAIPSRAEHGMSREDFLAHMPKEFWREVVDRVAAEVPDTLLLAEAFWLMEGYFVRTLGMHRVYNSAFMNMLKMEENGKYRQTVKNVLAFSPAVLQRFVNFMNNPDERTAVEQFGKGDKYFGVAILMATMPGLPMFGHGQIEGFAEKYGMEYRRAYWDEPVDMDMVHRHEREISPLLHQRGLFSGAENFALFDFVTPEGGVDENVFAYTNRHGQDRAVVLYNNAYSNTSGRIHTSTAINVAGDTEDPRLVQRSLTEALALDTGPNRFYRFRDGVGGQEYLRSGEELAREGMFAQLRGYEVHVFLEFRELDDTDGLWRELHGRLDGRPVPSLRRARRELILAPVLGPFAEANAPSALARLRSGRDDDSAALSRLLRETLVAAAAVSGSSSAAAVPDETRIMAALAPLGEPSDTGEVAAKKPATAATQATAIRAADARVLAYLALQLRWLTEVLDTSGTADAIQRLEADDLVLLLDRAMPGIAGSLSNTALREAAGPLAVLLGRHGDLLDAAPSLAETTRKLFLDPDAQAYLQSNRFDGVWYFSRERFEALVVLVRDTAALRADGDDKDAADAARCLCDAARMAGYRQEATLEQLAPPSAAAAEAEGGGQVADAGDDEVGPARP